MQGLLNDCTLDISLRGLGYKVTGPTYRAWNKQPARLEEGGYWQKEEEEIREEKRLDNKRQLPA